MPVRGRASFLSQQFKISNKGESTWLNGESVPSILRIPELARILGVTSEWLLTGDTKQSVITPTTNTSNHLCLQRVILLESKIKQLEDSKLSP